MKDGKIGVMKLSSIEVLLSGRCADGSPPALLGDFTPRVGRFLGDIFNNRSLGRGLMLRSMEVEKMTTD